MVAKPQMVFLFSSHLQNVDDTMPIDFSYHFEKLMVRDFVHYLNEGRKTQIPSKILPPLRPSPRQTLPINEERYCMPASMLPLVYLTLDYYMLYICRYALQMEIMYVDSSLAWLWFSKMACAYYHAFKEINPFQFLRAS